MAASAECRHWSGGQSVGQAGQFCLATRARDHLRPHATTFPYFPHTRARARAWRDTDNVVACGRKVSGRLPAEEVGAGRGLLWRKRRKGLW